MSGIVDDRAEIPQQNILEQALEQTAAGDSLDAVLAGAGPEADWLQPLLATATAVRELGNAVPIPSAEASLAEFLEEARAGATERSPEPSWRRKESRRPRGLRFPFIGVPRPVGLAVSLAAMLIVLGLAGALYLGTPSTAAAQSVLPGQPFYPVKRLGEEIYLWLPQSSTSRQARSDEYAQRRRDEVRELLDHRLQSQVVFQGKVEALGPGMAVVDRIVVQLTDETSIEGPLGLDAWVQVEGRTGGDQAVVAQRILVQGPAEPAAPPIPTSTPLPTAAPRPTATPAEERAPAATPAAVHTPAPQSPELDHSTHDVINHPDAPHDQPGTDSGSHDNAGDHSGDGSTGVEHDSGQGDDHTSQPSDSSDHHNNDAGATSSHDSHHDNGSSGGGEHDGGE